MGIEQGGAVRPVFRCRHQFFNDIHGREGQEEGQETSPKKEYAPLYLAKTCILRSQMKQQLKQDPKTCCLG